MYFCVGKMVCRDYAIIVKQQLYPPFHHRIKDADIFHHKFHSSFNFTQFFLLFSTSSTYFIWAPPHLAFARASIANCLAFSIYFFCLARNAVVVFICCLRRHLFPQIIVLFERIFCFPFVTIVHFK